MAVHYAVDGWKALVDFTVDISLQVARLCILLDCLGAVDLVLDEMVWRADERGRHVARHPEGGGVVRGAHRNVAVGVNDTIVLEDMAGGNEASEEILKPDLFALWKVSRGHGASGWMLYAT